MNNCRLVCHCGDQFLSADAYLAHLVASHEGTERLQGWLARGRELLSRPAGRCASDCAPRSMPMCEDVNPVRIVEPVWVNLTTETCA